VAESTKGGNVILRSVTVPDNVDPGDPVEVEAQVENGAAVIGPFDPDRCAGDTMDPGYHTTVEFEGPDGTVKTAGPTCLKGAAVGTGETDFTRSFYGLPAGDHRFSARVVMRDSGKSTDWMSDSTVVSENTVQSPEDTENSTPGDDSEDDNSNDPLPDVNAGLSGIGALVVGVVVLVVILESTSKGPNPAALAP
jgi:hypothetical protein